MDKSYTFIDVTDCGYKGIHVMYIPTMYIYKLPMILIELSVSCDLSIIAIVIDIRDKDSVQSYYHDILGMSVHALSKT